VNIPGEHQYRVTLVTNIGETKTTVNTKLPDYITFFGGTLLVSTSTVNKASENELQVNSFTVYPPSNKSTPKRRQEQKKVQATTHFVLQKRVRFTTVIYGFAAIAFSTTCVLRASVLLPSKGQIKILEVKRNYF